MLSRLYRLELSLILATHFKSIFNSSFKEIAGKLIIKNLIKNCRKDPIWIRISQKLFTSIPYEYLENSLLCLFNSSRQ
jgi:hypothetical protein